MSIRNRIAAIASSDGAKPNMPSSKVPKRKPAPFTEFFDPVRMATHRNSPSLSLGARILTALLALILVKSLATPDSPCSVITKTTEAVMLHVGSS